MNFGGSSYGPIIGPYGNSYGPMVLKVLLKFPPTLALVHGWLFPAIENAGWRFSWLHDGLFSGTPAMLEDGPSKKAH